MVSATQRRPRSSMQNEMGCDRSGPPANPFTVNPSGTWRPATVFSGLRGSGSAAWARRRRRPSMLTSSIRPRRGDVDADSKAVRPGGAEEIQFFFPPSGLRGEGDRV
jgi:hypothetical protein